MPDDGSILVPLPNPFIDAELPSFAEVLERIASDMELTAARRRDLASSIRCLMRLLELNPVTTPANLGALRARMKALHPAQAGITAKRLANIKADTSFALRHLGLIEASRRRAAPLTPDWSALWLAIENNQTRWKLSRLFRYCTALDIWPEDVDDKVIERLHAALVEESFVKEPGQTIDATIYAWNRAAEIVPSWPPRRLARRSSRRTGWTYPIEAFPQSFQDDHDRWISRLRGDDPLADDAPPRPLRPSTLKLRIFQIRMFASALARRNVPVNRITSLASLVEIENFKEALRFMLDRHDDKSTESIYNCAMTIKSVARHHVKVPPDHLDQLRRTCTRIKVKNTGLTPKNRRRLGQFDDPANVSRLLLLPARLEALAKRSGGRDSAVLMQMAVAIELLIMSPVRISNLANLELDENLFWIRPGRQGPLLLSIQPEDVKNRQPIEFELPDESAQLIARYLDRYRPLLFDDPGSWLFPGRDGRAKRPNGLGQQIGRHIRKHAGLEVNVHLMRHIGAKLYLDQNPGSHEVVRRVLAHRSLETTTAFYTGFETKAAARHFDEVILDKRRSAVPTKIRRGGGRSR